MAHMQHIDEWAKQIGGRFARVLELQSSAAGIMARVRTNFSMEGVAHRVPDDVIIPDNLRRLVDKGEIDARGFLRAR